MSRDEQVAARVRFELWLTTQPWWMRFLAYVSGVLDD